MSLKSSKVKNPELPSELVDRLVHAATEARKKAYAPYSRFHVGAALLTDDGRIFSGANVENASYGATMCAERAAIFGAVTAGCRKIEALAIVADYPAPVPPCGICRQVLSEFGRDTQVIMSNTNGDRRVETIETLLPFAFELGEDKES